MCLWRKCCPRLFFYSGKKKRLTAHHNNRQSFELTCCSSLCALLCVLKTTAYFWRKKKKLFKLLNCGFTFLLSSKNLFFHNIYKGHLHYLHTFLHHVKHCRLHVLCLFFSVGWERSICLLHDFTKVPQIQAYLVTVCEE